MLVLLSYMLPISSGSLGIDSKLQFSFFCRHFVVLHSTKNYLVAASLYFS